MSARRRWLIPLKAVLVACIAVAAWLTLRPPAPVPDGEPAPLPVPAATPPSEPAYASAAVWGREACLLPLAEFQPKEGLDFDKLWSSLFSALAADPQTAPLLQTLFGGLRVQFVEVAAKGIDDLSARTPLPPGCDLLLRGGGLTAKPVRGTAKDGKEVLGYRVELGCGCVAPSAFFGGEAPAYYDALFLALEDQVWRQQVGWRFRPLRNLDLDLLSQLQQPPPQTGAVRADLDQRIKDFAAGYRTWLAANGLQGQRP